MMSRTKTDIEALRPYSPRISHMTFWSRHDPVKLPQGYPDHWTKMKLKCTTFQVALPSGKIVGNADEYAFGVPKEDKIAIYKYNKNGNLTPESVQTFSDILTNDLGGNLPGSYDASRPKSGTDRDMLRSSFSIKAKEGFKYWEIERPKPTKFGRYGIGSANTILGIGNACRT